MSKRIVSAEGGALPAEGHKTRRAGQSGQAGALVIPKVAAKAAESADPIFTAIERHKGAWKAVGALGPRIDEVAALRKGREVTRVDWNAYERASAIEENALDELLATPPMTSAGMRASIEYLTSFDNGYLSESAPPFLATLLKSSLLAGSRSKA